jgi:FHA domain/Domain of unknown function (DUF4388)
VTDSTTHGDTSFRYLTISYEGHPPVALAPGRKLTIGRHTSNDVVLRDTQISRHHATLVWPAAEGPRVYDTGSTNGIRLNDKPVESQAVLQDGDVISVGKFLLEIRLEEAAQDPTTEGGLPPEHSATRLELFNDRGQEFEGVALDASDLHDVLIDLELQHRTGTLHVELHREQGLVTFCQGRVVTARLGELADVAAVSRLVRLQDGGNYRFTTSFEPSETFLDLSVSQLIDLEATQEAHVVPPLDLEWDLEG